MMHCELAPVLSTTVVLAVFLFVFSGEEASLVALRNSTHPSLYTFLIHSLMPVAIKKKKEEEEEEEEDKRRRQKKKRTKKKTHTHTHRKTNERKKHKSTEEEERRRKTNQPTNQPRTRKRHSKSPRAGIVRAFACELGVPGHGKVSEITARRVCRRCSACRAA
jgi:membrane peptidoglycan carboxypeptidase